MSDKEPLKEDNDNTVKKVVYFSQYGQDRYFDHYVFYGKRNGIFCDVGAHDGIDMSNSYYFEKNLDWTGICIEAQPKEYANLVKNRKCPCVHGAAYNRSGEIVFRDNSGYTNMLSGIDETYSDAHRQRLNNEIRIKGGESTLITVPCFTLSEIFDKYGYKHIDILSIDTEGSEKQILQGIDFEKVHINAITVEVNYPNSPEHIAIHELLTNNRFENINIICGDEIWVNKDFKI
jgi:FkbM family methyltransferase